MIKSQDKTGSCEILNVISVKGNFCSIEEFDEESILVVFDIRHEGKINLVLKSKDAQNLHKARQALKMQSCHEVLVSEREMSHGIHREILEICA